MCANFAYWHISATGRSLAVDPHGTHDDGARAEEQTREDIRGSQRQRSHKRSPLTDNRRDL
jgi:hypothetical protein